MKNASNLSSLEKVPAFFRQRGLWGRRQLFKTGAAFLLVLALFLSGFSFMGSGEEPLTQPVTTSAARQETAGAPEIKAKSGVLVDVSTGTVLCDINGSEKLPPASITKVMSALLFMQAIDDGRLTYDTPVTCSEHAHSMGGSQIWLEIGETMTVDQLLKAVMVGSANDATVALAEAVAGTEDAFVALMNQQAASLGMNDTHFENATGLDADGHLTTAKDIAIMSRALLQHPDIMKYSTIWMDSLRDGKTSLVNTNKLVHSFEGITGLKTGTTSKAGSCLSASANRDGLHLIAVVMGSDNSADRFESARNLLNYGFTSFTVAKPIDISDQLEDIKVRGGLKQQLTLQAEQAPEVVVKKGRENDIKTNITTAQDVTAPVEQGQIVGKVSLLLDDKTVGEYNIIAAESIPEMTLGGALGLMFGSFFKMG